MGVSDPEDRHRNHPEGAVAVSTVVVAGGEGPELLAAVDQALHAVAQAVDGFVERPAAALTAETGDGVADAPSPQPGAARPAGVPFVADYPRGAHAGAPAAGSADGPLRQQSLEGGRLVPLTRRQHQRQRLAAALCAEMDLRREAAPAAPQRFRFRVPPFAPAACWCARITVPSTKCTVQSSCPAASAWRWTAAKIWSQTPALVQRRKRVYTLGQGPYRSGRSRHGTPVVSFQRIPFTTSRSSLRGAPAFSGGNSGWSRSHSASLTSCRRRILVLQEVTIMHCQHNSPPPNSPIEDRP